jgi:hypothetical protein
MAAVESKVRPEATRISTPIKLNQVLERGRLFLMITDLMTDLVGHSEPYACLMVAPGGLEVHLADRERDVCHPRAGDGDAG